MAILLNLVLQLPIATTLAMIYQGEIVYIINCYCWSGSKGGLRGLKTPPMLNNLFTIENYERFKCDGRVLERNDR